MKGNLPFQRPAFTLCHLVNSLINVFQNVSVLVQGPKLEDWGVQLTAPANANDLINGKPCVRGSSEINCCFYFIAVCNLSHLSCLRTKKVVEWENMHARLSCLPCLTCLTCVPCLTCLTCLTCPTCLTCLT